MTERERWVVYPLLFLALGASLRDKLFDRTTARSIVCEELTVLDAAKIGRIDSPGNGAPAKGYMILNGQLNAEVINARQYAYQGAPFVPAFQAMPLGLYAQFLQALQQAAAQQAQQQQPQQPQTAPPNMPQPPDGPSEESQRETETLAEPDQNE